MTTKGAPSHSCPTNTDTRISGHHKYSLDSPTLIPACCSPGTPVLSSREDRESGDFLVMGDVKDMGEPGEARGEESDITVTLSLCHFVINRDNLCTYAITLLFVTLSRALRHCHILRHSGLGALRPVWRAGRPAVTGCRWRCGGGELSPAGSAGGGRASRGGGRGRLH